MPELSGAEIERMREIVQAHDRQHKPMQEMDLNKPPQQRYVHQEYPKMLYHHDERESTTVQNADEEQAAREEGFTHEPYSSEPEEVQLDADAQREVAAIEKRLDEIRSKAAKKQKAKARRPE